MSADWRQQEECEEMACHELQFTDAEFCAEVWGKLSSIDVNKYVSKKMNLSYLSWAWAWGTLMNNYPASSFSFRDVSKHDDGTVEVWVDVTVRSKRGSLKRSMWLPVMDHRNNAISEPNARQISDTRMRCLTKCLAMFGLGHYIYAGEDLPQENPKDVKQRENKVEKYATQIITMISEERSDEVAEAWRELSEEEQKIAWVAKTKGGFFTQKEKEYIRGALNGS